MHYTPILYKYAAELLELAKEQYKNVKTILYNDPKYRFMNIKPIYALVVEALRHWDVLETLILDSQILTENSLLNVWLIRVFVTELIFGKKTVDSENKYGQIVLNYENKFKEILATQHVQELLTRSKQDVEVKVRYIKVNTIKVDVDSIITSFKEEGWQQLPTADSYQGYLDQLVKLKPHSQQFLQDFHIPEVLVFPSGTEFYLHYLYKNGSFFCMDKSSCLAPLLLRPHEHSTVLDMCAAPGMKTIHLAGLVQTGKVYAVERDANRFKSLKELVGLSGAENVVTIQKDVTKLELEKYTDVEYILVDPSCSGSGMRDRQPHFGLEPELDDPARLYKLAGFQLSLLRFAFTRFPAAKRVVYSTCSLNVEENEEVVEAALNSKFHNFKIVSAGKRLPEWINFGSDKFYFGQKCIYSRPETDFTNGFFVAVFKRNKHFPVDSCYSEVKASGELDGTYHNARKRNSGEKTYSSSKGETKSFFQQRFDGTQNNGIFHKKNNKKGGFGISGTDNISHNILFNKHVNNEKIIDTTDEKHCLPKKIKGVDDINAEHEIIHGKPVKYEIEKYTPNSHKKSLSSKVKTASLKKRVRKMKRSLSKTKKVLNNKTNKRKDKIVNSIIKKLNVSEKLQVSTNKNQNVAKTNKISRARKRYQRLKKIKLVKQSNNSFEPDEVSKNVESPKIQRQKFKKSTSNIISIPKQNKIKCNYSLKNNDELPNKATIMENTNECKIILDENLKLERKKQNNKIGMPNNEVLVTNILEDNTSNNTIKKSKKSKHKQSIDDFKEIGQYQDVNEEIIKDCNTLGLLNSCTENTKSPRKKLKRKHSGKLLSTLNSLSEVITKENNSNCISEQVKEVKKIKTNSENCAKNCSSSESVIVEHSASEAENNENSNLLITAVNSNNNSTQVKLHRKNRKKNRTKDDSVTINGDTEIEKTDGSTFCSTIKHMNYESGNFKLSTKKHKKNHTDDECVTNNSVEENTDIHSFTIADHLNKKDIRLHTKKSKKK